MALPPFSVSKLLTSYDITKKLGLPTKILQHIQIPQGAHSVELQVTDSGEQVTFQLYTRPRGNRANPVITRGWLEFARAKRLQTGDKLIIYGGQDGELQIQIQRTSYVTFLGGPVYLDVENFPRSEVINMSGGVSASPLLASEVLMFSCGFVINYG